MTNLPETETNRMEPTAAARTLWDRLDDRIASVHPDIWLAGAVVAVIAPWLDRLA